jgi:predicted enzyme related to lactoylglutathione lyase
MQITSSGVSLNVDDVNASSKFLSTYFGFREEMSADGFVSLGRDDSGMKIAFLRRGLPTLPEDFRDQRTSGVIVALVVTDIAAEEARLRHEGVEFTMPLQDEPWGERFFQVTDPNGVIIQLVEWVTPSGE